MLMVPDPQQYDEGYVHRMYLDFYGEFTLQCIICASTKDKVWKFIGLGDFIFNSDI